MIGPRPRGQVYRCEVCGAEVAVLVTSEGVFRPRCCNTDMAPVDRRLVFYECPICGAEVAVVQEGNGLFRPRCCNTDMLRQAA